MFTSGEEEPAPISKPYDSEDVGDASLVDWMLSLSPLERLAALQSQVNSLAKLRDAFADR